MVLDLTINNKSYRTDIDPATPLLWALRDSLGLTGTKFGCGAGLCGACTVHLDDEAVRSSQTPDSSVVGNERRTLCMIQTSMRNLAFL